MSNKKTKLIKSTGNAAAVSRGKHLTRLHQAYTKAFAKIPDDYSSLKEEAIYLGKLSGHAFVLMAARLKKIKDLSLYKEDNYPSFKQFVDAEMSLDRSTVYNYMDILEAFGQENLLAEPELEYTKLRPAVPLLKAKVTGVPKAKIKKQFIAKAKTSTRKEMVETAKELKSRYGLTPRSSAQTPRSSAVARSRRTAEQGAGGQTLSAGARSQLSSAIKTFLASIPEGKLSEEQKQELLAAP